MPFRLYVRGVDGTLTLKGPQLADLFAKYGKVLQIQTGEQGFAFVDMESEKECEEAIKGLDGFQFEGNKLAVEKAKSSERERERDRGDKGEFRCYNCSKPGHLARDCKEKPRNPNYLDTRGTKIDKGNRVRTRRSPPRHSERFRGRSGYGGGGYRDQGYRYPDSRYENRRPGGGYHRGRSPPEQRDPYYFGSSYREPYYSPPHGGDYPPRNFPPPPGHNNGSGSAPPPPLASGAVAPGIYPQDPQYMRRMEPPLPGDRRMSPPPHDPYYRGRSPPRWANDYPPDYYRYSPEYYRGRSPMRDRSRSPPPYRTGNPPLPYPSGPYRGRSPPPGFPGASPTLIPPHLPPENQSSPPNLVGTLPYQTHDDRSTNPS